MGRDVVMRAVASAVLQASCLWAGCGTFCCWLLACPRHPTHESAAVESARPTANPSLLPRPHTIHLGRRTRWSMRCWRRCRWGRRARQAACRSQTCSLESFWWVPLVDLFSLWNGFWGWRGPDLSTRELLVGGAGW